MMKLRHREDTDLPKAEQDLNTHIPQVRPATQSHVIFPQGVRKTQMTSHSCAAHNLKC